MNNVQGDTLWGDTVHYDNGTTSSVIDTGKSCLPKWLGSGLSITSVHDRIIDDKLCIIDTHSHISVLCYYE